MKCENCGVGPYLGNSLTLFESFDQSDKNLHSFYLFDHCEHCGKKLCFNCMTKGCCGHKPAESGDLKDYREDISQD
jgi:hypothetical protein